MNFYVGANCVRPFGLQHFITGEHSSPLQNGKTIFSVIKFYHRICVKLYHGHKEKSMKWYAD